MIVSNIFWNFLSSFIRTNLQLNSLIKIDRKTLSNVLMLSCWMQTFQEYLENMRMHWSRQRKVLEISERPFFFAWSPLIQKNLKQSTKKFLTANTSFQYSSREKKWRSILKTKFFDDSVSLLRTGKMFNQKRRALMTECSNHIEPYTFSNGMGGILKSSIVKHETKSRDWTRI